MHRELSDAKWNRIKANNPIGKDIEALIVVKTKGGLILDAGRNGIGFLRKYKISNASKYMGMDFPETGYVHVIVDGYDDERKQLEFSILGISQREEALRKVDPENNEHEVKVRCRIRAHRYNGFYTVLESGIDGFLPIDEIPATKGLRPEQILYVDDIIDALVTEVNYDRSLAILSIKRLWEVDQDLVRPVTSHRFRPPRMIEDLAPRSYRDYEHGEQRQVLLLESDGGDAEIIRSFLHQQGHTVFHAPTLNEAFEVLSQHTSECVISGFRFDNSPLDGLEICEQIHSKYPTLPFMFFSRLIGEAEASRILNSSIPTIDILDKFSELSILGQVVATLRGRKSQQGSQYPTEVALDISDLDQKFYVNCYDKAESLFPDIKMAVFRRDPQSKDYELVYFKGIDQVHYREVSYDIKYSPINNVIVGDDHIYVPDVGEGRAFEKIRDADEGKVLTFFRCFTGFPLRVMGKREYGLFFFHESEHGFDDDVYLLRLAHELAMSMEDVRLTEKILDTRQVNQISNILPTMLHELSKDIYLHNITAGRIVELLRTLAIKEQSDQDWKLVFDMVDMLDEQARELTDTLESYLMTFRLDDIASGTSVPQFLETMVKSLRYTASDIYNVSLSLGSIDNRMNHILCEPKRLFHALVNILLNAFYHTCQVHRKNGKVSIHASYESDGGIRPVKIRVKDNGLGIHYGDIGQIFKPYYTTKPPGEGSGLGLYIALKCVEEMGGRLLVEDTAMYSGATFLIEIPEIKVRKTRMER